MRQFVDLQDKYKTFIMIADYHALNIIKEKDQMSQNILDIALDYLAIGLDPKKVIIFKQSDVSAHAELTWIFDTLVPMPFLMRAHAYKDALAKDKEISVGTFNYPVLMAADILLYDTDIVPVGQDQKQHVEYARDIALKYNNQFGDIFKLPEPFIVKDLGVIPGTDGQKMSKSYKNTIPLFGTDEEIKKAVMGIITDSKEADEPKDPEACNIFALHKLFLNKEEQDALRQRYLNGSISYKESKEMLLSEIIKFIEPMRQRRLKLAQNINKVKKILKNGAKKAEAIANKKMDQVKESVGLVI
jgi:tryptophanyl-tRNA synthetase